MGFYDYRKSTQNLTNAERKKAQNKQWLHALYVPAVIIVLFPVIIFFCRTDRTTGFPDFNSTMNKVIEDDSVHIDLDDYRKHIFVEQYKDQIIKSCGNLEDYCLTVDSVVQGAVYSAVEIEEMLFTSFEDLSRKEMKKLSQDISRKLFYMKTYIEKMNFLIMDQRRMPDFDCISNTLKLYEDLEEFTDKIIEFSDVLTYTFRNHLVELRKNYISIFEQDFKNICISRVALYEDFGLGTDYKTLDELKKYPQFGISYSSLPDKDTFYFLIPYYDTDEPTYGPSAWFDYDQTWVPIWYPD